MTNEQITSILAALKVDLQMSTTAYDERLKQIIKSSYENIVAMGAQSLDVDEDRDREIVIKYAAWTWRRRESGEGMPRMLALDLNNRIFGEKANG